MKTDRNMEDMALLHSLQRGNQEAFDGLFRMYYPMLCAYAHRFVEQADAEEIVQDVMLWMWEKRLELPIESSLSQYLFKTTYHRALNLIARKEVISRAETFFYTKHQEMPEEVDYYQIEELSRKIEEAIDALPESYRSAFIMHRFKNMSYKEIAAVYDVSPKTIDYRIQQSLKLLREELKDYLPVTLLFALGIC
ncbi:RNA polymerase sigma-70 factor [uncultured Bacteroides sp.]|uniref:RNA polymerase sigma-70 factor n=1 Tax=uncultured Bacteroides sp. TaxID=162156 RepID=UPI0023C027DE|nr:RNA polymerase sigma-70 factor [uncultured Bacteroides sp.]MDE5761410.1 RNA polymerase sigma-70 factor [Bacteroides sp.]